MAEIQDEGTLERLKNFFAQQMEREAERKLMEMEARTAAVKALKPTKAQAAWLATQFAPGAGVTDAAGAMASFPSSDVELQDAFSGEPMPSMAEHLGQGGWGYLHAGLQGLGSLGDAAYAVPLIGPAVGSVIKAPGVLGKIAKTALTAQRVGKGSKGIDEGIASLKPIFHGTNKEFDELDVNFSADGSIWFTDDYAKAAQGYEGASGKGIVIERLIDENKLKLATRDDIDNFMIDQLIGKGFDGAKFDDVGGNEVVYQIWNPEKLKITPAAEIDQGIGALPRAGTTSLRVTSDTSLPKEMAEVETRFTQQLNADLDGAIDQYKNLPDSDGGRIINTDLARELSPDYVADRTLSAAVHEPASAFTKAYYAKLLSEPPPPGKFNEVLFTGGGTGAGKSTALADALLEKTVRSQIVYDTNLAGFPSSVKKIDEALDAGKDVTVAYVYRDPIEALTGGGEFGGGAVQRAKRMGRTVPVDIHVGTHVRSIETIQDLAKHYEKNPNVDIRLIDNTGGKGNAFDVGNDLSRLPEYDYNALLKEATDELNKARKEGWLPQKLYEGFIPTKAGS